MASISNRRFRAMLACSGRVGWLGVLFFGACAVGARAQQQDPKAREMVQVAMQTELDASRDDHSRWEYKDLYKGESGEKILRVVETSKGALKKKVEENGRRLSP